MSWNFGQFECNLSQFVRVHFGQNCIPENRFFSYRTVSLFGFPAPLTLRAILGTLRGQNWGKTSFKNNCVGANSKNRMPVWCSRLNDAREHLCTSYMQAFFATPGQVRGTQSKKENLWALSVFRLNLMLNHHVGRQPPEICVFSSHFLEICENVSKISIFGISSENLS